MLPDWSRFTGQLDAGIARFPGGRRQVADGEPDEWSAVKVLPARVERAAEDAGPVEPGDGDLPGRR